MPEKRSDSSMFNSNKLKLGVFASNCSSGMAITKVPERWDASWEGNLALARLADEAGIEFMLPIARFKGFGGETDFQSSTLETLTWATGLLAHTEKLTVFGTMIAPLVHPIFASKQMVTADHISGGRLGLNVVCGWQQDEFDMFGIEQYEHDMRYDHGQEWLDVIRNLWRNDEPVDFEGKFFSLKGLAGDPKPVGGTEPVIMNAGSSGRGREYAARNCDFLFTILIDPETGAKDVQDIKALGRTFGRDLDVFTTTHIVCRPTDEEAKDFHRYYVDENADWEAVEKLMHLQGMYGQSFPPDAFKMYRDRFAGGHGTYPIVGSPDTVAAELERISAAGFVGATISFVDYVNDLTYFNAEVLPRLEAKGLRKPTP
ncbi:LLM class flavin-dependent oxidoreductase [Pseudonocardia sp.]|uniref:LLM class flavin-dependent oxidoreductase n=1 Tax=Pseudonocardia sp. TaxID=60912 RepID=UPI00260F6C34|nr:LLM class flavin-dependent oxidoreductase [Pseudonocardia sp.]